MELKFLRPAKDDAEQIYRFLANNFLYYNPDMVDTEPELMRIYRRVKDNIGSYRLVKYGGKMAAYYYFHEYKDMMRLDDIHVLPRFRNRGIGTAIVRRCLSETEQPICAEIYYHNVYAMSLFKHNGFIIMERIDARKCIVVNKNDSDQPYYVGQYANIVFSGNRVFTY